MPLYEYGSYSNKVHSCPEGYERITSTSVCNLTCSDLELNTQGVFKSGRPCYKAGNKKCRQNGGYGSSAVLICKKKGIFLILKSRDDPNELTVSYSITTFVVAFFYLQHLAGR